MRIGFAEQFSRACVVLNELDDDFADVHTFAVNNGATYEDEPGHECLVIQFPNRPPELYTHEAARRSLERKNDREQNCRHLIETLEIIDLKMKRMQSLDSDGNVPQDDFSLLIGKARSHVGDSVRSLELALIKLRDKRVTVP